MKILSFGIAREIVGSASVEVPLDEEVSVGSLQAGLEERYPGLKKLSSFLIAVNGAYASPGTIIKAGDEIAIIPPVSGG